MVLCAAVLLGLAACRVPPRAGDPTIEPREVFEPIFHQPTTYLHVVGVNGAGIPRRAIEASARTVSRHLGRPVEICDHGQVELPDGHSPWVSFPVLERGRPLTGSCVSDASPVYRLAAPDRGILGVVGRDIGDAAPGAARLIPLVGPEAILVIAVPGPASGRGVTGYATTVADSAEEFRTGLVVLHRSVIQERSSLFVSERKLWEWTLTHEIGHVLGVPSSNSHQWRVPGLGPHCTHPECVMYTGVDWRVVVSGLLRGWPLDYCRACEAELRAARDAAQPASPPG